MTETSNHMADAAGWATWVKNRSLIVAKLKGADRSNPPAYFIALHAATEALFRQILFVGLRLNRVTYKEAQDWLHLHDSTPDTTEYPRRFDCLYSIKSTTWNLLVAQHPQLDRAITLWHAFSKAIRNHLAHGIRSYSDDWLQCAIQSDQHLLMELDHAMAPIVGGSIANTLARLLPRLPIGKKGRDIAKLTGVKLKKPRPGISLVSAQKQLEELRLAPLGQARVR